MRGHKKEETEMKTAEEIRLDKMLAEGDSIVRVGKGEAIDLTEDVVSILSELQKLRLDKAHLEEEIHSLRNPQEISTDGDEPIQQDKEGLTETSSAALNSMNYLFLRMAFKGDDIGETTVSELESFFQNLVGDEKSLSDKETREVFLSEIAEGEYFEGKSESEVRAIILEATEEWMVEPEKVADFYISLMKEEETD